jgi:hypothetical protein
MEALKELIKESKIMLIIALIPIGLIINNIKRTFGTT